MTTAELGLGAATPIDGPSPEREPLANAEATTLTRNERLDRLPFNKAHRKLLMASGIGWAFDAMDVGSAVVRRHRHRRRPAFQP